jgi:hypothetical protein
MKQTILTMSILFLFASPASVLAVDQAVVETIVSEQEAIASEQEAVVLETLAITSDTEAATAENNPALHQKHDGAKSHKGKCKRGKGQGGKHGGGQHGKGKHDKHEQVVRRLDMIEARMAKIEAMLESLMRR